MTKQTWDDQMITWNKTQKIWKPKHKNWMVQDGIENRTMKNADVGRSDLCWLFFS